MVKKYNISSTFNNCEKKYWQFLEKHRSKGQASLLQYCEYKFLLLPTRKLFFLFEKIGKIVNGWNWRVQEPITRSVKLPYCVCKTANSTARREWRLSNLSGSHPQRKLKMTMNAAQVIETSVNANNNSPSREHPRASVHTRQITIPQRTSLRKIELATQ